MTLFNQLTPPTTKRTRSQKRTALATSLKAYSGFWDPALWGNALSKNLARLEEHKKRWEAEGTADTTQLLQGVKGTNSQKNRLRAGERLAKIHFPTTLPATQIDLTTLDVYEIKFIYQNLRNYDGDLYFVPVKTCSIVDSQMTYSPLRNTSVYVITAAFCLRKS
jgi:hypothetical protein